MKSISASGHKFGLAPLGCWLGYLGDEEALPQELVFNVDYLGGQIGTFAINFSRPAGQVIAQYYEFLRLGREGYTKVQNASYQVARYLADEIAKLGPYEFICTGRPDEGIPAVCFKLKMVKIRDTPCTTSLNVCVCAAGRFRPSLSAVKPPTSW